MDYYNNVLTIFLALTMVIQLLSIQGQKTLGFHQKYLNFCYNDEQRPCVYMMVSNQLQDSIFWVNKPFLKTRVFGLTWYDAVSLQ